MRNHIFLLGVLLSCSSCDQLSQTARSTRQPPDFSPIPVTYPATFQDTTVVDDYYGKLVSDPYRWLEDESSTAVQNWIEAENNLTFTYLDQIPYRTAIQQRLEKLWKYERYTSPLKRGGKYYFFKNDGLQQQDVLYVQNTLDTPPQVVLDPNQLSKDGAVTIKNIEFSKDNSLLAFQFTTAGANKGTIQVLNVASNQLLPDRLEGVKNSNIAWYENGFFYSRYPESPEDTWPQRNEFHQLYYHQIGTTQEEDELVFADRANPRRIVYGQTTADERFLILTVKESATGNALYFRDLRAEDVAFTPIIETFDYDFKVIGNFGDRLLVLTNYQSPNQRLLLINVHHPEPGFWEQLLPERADVLQYVHLLGGRIVATYLRNASSVMVLFSTAGVMLGELGLPSLGTVADIQGNLDDTEAFFAFTSFSQPSTIYRLDMNRLEYEIFKTPTFDFQPADYTTEQLWYESYDGTRVPLFVTYKKGLAKNGTNPTLLYGYGGFNTPVLPSFHVLQAALLESGGIYAVANIRGGGEFGASWHEAGTKKNKQNSFNDFQAAAEYLIANNYTSTAKLAIEGHAAGGLLVGACITQRPDLYKVAFPSMGVLDMLRYHQFNEGWAWADEYGVSTNPQEFDALISYSPVHNVVPANYPATFITTAGHDDRVVPAHSFKFAAALQANQTAEQPVLIRIAPRAEYGKPINHHITEAADRLSFMLYNMEVDVRY